MGLHKTIRDEAKLLCAKAFRTIYTIITGFVVVNDVLTTLRVYSPSRDMLWTGSQAFSMVISQARDAFERGAKVYIYCCDVHSLVTSFKHAEQRRRDRGEKSKDEEKKQKKRKKKDDEDLDKIPPKPILKYPDSAEFSDDGIRCVDSTQEAVHDAKTGKIVWRAVPNASETVERFDMNRVLASRDVVRTKFWKYILDKFAATKAEADKTGGDYLFSKGVPMDKLLVFDVGLGKDKAPIAFFSNMPNKLDLTNYTHQFGEADHMLVYWARLFRNWPVMITTNDQDQMGLSVVYAAQASPPLKKPFIWRYPDQRKNPPKPFIYMDVTMVARSLLWVEMTKVDPQIEPGLKSWTAMSWLLACFLLKTDFVEKSSVTPGIGEENAWDLAYKHRSDLDKVRIDMTTLRQIDKERMEAEQKEGKTDIVENIWPQIPNPENPKQPLEMVHDQWCLIGPQECEKGGLRLENGFVPDPHLVQFFEKLHPGKPVYKFLRGMYHMMFQAHYYLVDWNKLRQADPYTYWTRKIREQLAAKPTEKKEDGKAAAPIITGNKRKHEDEEGDEFARMKRPRIDMSSEGVDKGEKVPWKGDDAELMAI